MTGNFAVDMSGNIFQEKEILHTGDWCMQGYVNYPGGMIYQYKVPRLISDKQVLLHLGEWCGTLLKVRVNGKETSSHFEKKNCVTDVTGSISRKRKTLWKSKSPAAQETCSVLFTSPIPAAAGSAGLIFAPRECSIRMGRC